MKWASVSIIDLYASSCDLQWEERIDINLLGLFLVSVLVFTNNLHTSHVLLGTIDMMAWELSRLQKKRKRFSWWKICVSKYRVRK